MTQRDLFSSPAGEVAADAPLAERMRPVSLDEILGQGELIGNGRPLRVAIEQDRIGSLILWGPPGSGKTTLARIIAQQTACHFQPFSAVVSGIKEIKAVMSEALHQKQMFGRRTLLFVDEIHRFNKAQQDAFLPHVEAGTVILIGATTENPSFEVNAALLSRCRVIILGQLGPDELKELMIRAMEDPKRGLGGRITLEPPALDWLAMLSNGDARFVMNVLEAVDASMSGTIDRKALETVVQRKALRYDKSGEEHFNLMSALHKSLRNSDVDASLYWLARMLEAGEDALYIARRLVRFASEDIGLAEPGALGQALAAKEAFHFIGPPEGKLALAQAVVYLAAAPKSNAVYRAYAAAAEDALKGVTEPVPLHLRNAVTGAMKSWGYGRDYAYAHDDEQGLTAMTCLPDSLADKRYYHPSRHGFEDRLGKRLREIRRAQARPAGANTDIAAEGGRLTRTRAVLAVPARNSANPAPNGLPNRLLMTIDDRPPRETISTEPDSESFPLVTLLVSDLEASIAFYRLLGAQSVSERGGMAILEHQGRRFALYPASDLAGYLALGPAAPHGLPPALVLSVRTPSPGSLHTIHRQLTERGVTVAKPPHRTPWSRYAAFYLDPDSNLVEVSAPLPAFPQEPVLPAPSRTR